MTTKTKLVMILMMLFALSVYSQWYDTLKTKISAGDEITLEVLEVEPDAFPVIGVIFRAENQRKEPLWRLEKSDITVTENDDTCRIIKLGMLSRQTPVNIALTVDHSGSMELEDGLINAKKGITRLLENLNTKKDSLIIIGFATKVSSITPLTNDKQVLMNSVEAMEAGGQTAYYDAISKAIDNLQNHAGVKAIIALTDGQDNRSSYSRSQIIAKRKESGIPIYIVYLNTNETVTGPGTVFLVETPDGEQEIIVPTNPIERKLMESQLFNPQEMEDFAEDIGAEYYYTSSPEKLPEIYEEITRKIHAIYELKYASPNYDPNDSERRIAIQFNNARTEYDPDELKYFLTDDILKRLLKAQRNRKLLFAGIPIAIITGFIIMIGFSKKEEINERDKPQFETEYIVDSVDSDVAKKT